MRSMLCALAKQHPMHLMACHINKAICNASITYTTPSLQSYSVEGLHLQGVINYTERNTTATLSACIGNAQPWRFFYACYLRFAGAYSD